jgi:hypothetical protein
MPNVSNYTEQGGEKTVIGGEIDITGDLKIDSTTVTSTAAELNILDGVTSTAAELNILDGVTATSIEINTLDLSAVGAVKKYAKAPLTIVAAATSNDTAIVLPAKAIITNVWVDVTTQEATGGTKTVDIGISGGDEDGLLAGVSVAAAGIIKGAPTITTGSNEVYFASTTKGALMASLTAGTDVATDVGTYYEFDDVTSGGATIAYTLGSDDFAELVANVIVEYIEIA